MKHTKLLLVGAFILGGATVASAQSTDNRAYVDQDQEKLEMINSGKLLEQAEIDKMEAQQNKLIKTMEYHGMVAVPGFTYDPNISHKENVTAYKIACEKLKTRNFALYQQLGLDQ